jgi:hypothetical protein
MLQKIERRIIMKKITAIALLAALVACGEKEKTAPPAVSQGPAAIVDASGYMETTAAVKLRSAPSVKSAIAKCRSMDVNDCHDSDCGGESSVIPRERSVPVVKRTDVKENISGAEGYWYQIGGQGNQCKAWIFGGFLKPAPDVK